MGTDASSWAGAAEALAGHARVILPDRRGYGATPAPEPYGSTTVAEQAEDLAAVVEEARATPAVVAGVDFGALACLDLVLRHSELVRAAVLVDPPLLMLVPAGTEALAAERLALEEKLREGGPQAAMEAWLGHASDASPTAFFADFAGLATLSLRRRDLRALRCPMAVVTTPRAAAPVRAAAAALVAALPVVEVAEDPVAALRALLAERASGA
jgi:pimeloyl-ACP methyl ester carboxylesterase